MGRLWRGQHRARVFLLAVDFGAGEVVRPLWPTQQAFENGSLFSLFGIIARVVELVDTQVSEACALTACEFESRLGHQQLRGRRRKLFYTAFYTCLSR
jgi:hypothetical protein